MTVVVIAQGKEVAGKLECGASGIVVRLVLLSREGITTEWGSDDRTTVNVTLDTSFDGGVEGFRKLLDTLLAKHNELTHA